MTKKHSPLSVSNIVALTAGGGITLLSWNEVPPDIFTKAASATSKIGWVMAFIMFSAFASYFIGFLPGAIGHLACLAYAKLHCLLLSRIQNAISFLLGCVAVAANAYALKQSDGALHVISLALLLVFEFLLYYALAEKMADRLRYRGHRL